MQQIRLTGTIALYQLKVVAKLHGQRYKAMCPRFLGKYYDRHAESIDRLMNSKPDVESPNSGNARSGKIPREGLRLHVNQHAYDEYARTFIAAFKSYLAGPYMNWLHAKRKFEKQMASVGLSEKDYQEWQKWWATVFQVEMSKWENHLSTLTMPSWEDAIDQVYQELKEKAEPGAFYDFYISSGYRV